MRIFACVLSLMLLCEVLNAQVPRAISYQGILTDANGNAVSDGSHTLRLKLFDVASGGTELFSETQNVVTVKGLFNVVIGSASGGIPTSIAFDRPYFLGVSVDGTTELIPRTEMLSAPYSLRAAVADALAPGAAAGVTSLNGGTGAMTLEGGGGTTVNRSGNTITISSTGGTGGSGIQGIQNSDGTIAITNPNGPVANIRLGSGVIPTSLPPNGSAGGDLIGSYPNPSVASGAITSGKLADNSVISAKILDGTVLTADLAAGVIPTSLPPNGTAGGDLRGTYPNPSIALNAVSTPTIATNAVTSTKIADSTIVAADLAPGVIPTSLPPSGAAGGDLSSTYPNPTVARLQGRSVSSSTPSTGQVLKYNGTAWAPSTDDAGPWSVNGTNISSTNSGNVGIGTTSPATKLEINGTTRTRDLQITAGASSGRTLVSNASGTAVWTTDLKIVGGNVGIGDTTPKGKLHVVAGSSGFDPSFTRTAVFEEDGHLTLSLRGPSTMEQSILFERPVGDTGMRISSQPDGDMRIGRYRFTDNGSASSSFHLFLDVQTGNFGIKRDPVTNDLEVDGTASKLTAGDWLANSDRRIKTDIRDIRGSFETLLLLRPVTFRYSDEWRRRNPEIEDRPYYNFIAQEYRTVFPHAVKGSGEYLDGDPNQILQIDTYDAQIVTIKAVQDLIRENRALQERNDQLQQQIDQVKTDLQKISTVVIELRQREQQPQLGH